MDPKGGGVPKGNVQLLLDTQATQVALRSALGTTLARRAVGGDTVFIYYAGHGAPETDLANREPDGYAKYLVPYDANPQDLFATAINMAEVETFFSRIKADTVILALDTCYSGAGGGRGFANLPPGGRDITLKGDFLTRLAQGKGRAILTAADTNEVALELPDLGHGLFTYHLLEGLRGQPEPEAHGPGRGGRSSSPGGRCRRLLPPASWFSRARRRGRKSSWTARRRARWVKRPCAWRRTRAATPFA